MYMYSTQNIQITKTIKCSNIIRIQWLTHTVCAILLYLIKRLTWLGVSTSSDLSVPVDAESLLLETMLLSETFLSSSFRPDGGRGELSGVIFRGFNFRTIFDFLTFAGGELGLVSVGVFEMISPLDAVFSGMVFSLLRFSLVGDEQSCAGAPVVGVQGWVCSLAPV